MPQDSSFRTNVHLSSQFSRQRWTMPLSAPCRAMTVRTVSVPVLRTPASWSSSRLLTFLNLQHLFFLPFRLAALRILRTEVSLNFKHSPGPFTPYPPLPSLALTVLLGFLILSATSIYFSPRMDPRVSHFNCALGGPSDPLTLRNHPCGVSQNMDSGFNPQVCH